MLDMTNFQSRLMTDTGTAVVDTLDDIVIILKSCDALLSLQNSKPVKHEYIIPLEKNLLANGLYNGGVVGFRRSDETCQMIKWFKSRLYVFSEASKARAASRIDSKDDFLFVVQLWLQLLTSYLENLYISSDPSPNLGHWNPREGKLHDDSNVKHFFFDNRKVKNYHFSGLPDDDLGHVTKFNSMYRDSPSGVRKKAAGRYLQTKNENSKQILSTSYTYVDLQPHPAPSIAEHPTGDTKSIYGCSHKVLSLLRKLKSSGLITLNRQ